MWNFLRSSKPIAPAIPARPATSVVDLVDPAVMERIAHLDLLSRTVVDGLLAGKHRSTTKGGCSEFAQHRPYAPGDEVRQIDWQVYARNDRYFIKRFEEETNLQALIALDASGSMRFGMETGSKYEYARRTAACLSRLLLHQRDAVGAVVLHEQQARFVPPRQHAAHLRAILGMLQAIEPGGSAGLGGPIRIAAARLRRRGMFILLSDCFGDLDELAEGLRVVRARGHDILVFNVLAPEELDFRFRRWSEFRSLEVSGQRLRLEPAAVREEYLQKIRAHLQRVEALTMELGGDYVRLTTDRPLGDALQWFLRGRLARGA